MLSAKVKSDEEKDSILSSSAPNDADPSSCNIAHANVEATELRP